MSSEESLGHDLHSHSHNTQVKGLPVNIQHYLERRNLDPEQDAHEGLMEIHCF